MRTLTVDDARAAALGGLVFGAGGGGLEAGLRAAETVFSLGRPTLASLDELDPDDQVIVSTGVGAPGSRPRSVYARDKFRAMELLRRHIRESSDFGPDIDAKIVGTIVGHPGAGMAASWMHAVLDPRTFVVDCATNGRGHPSVKMGGMGLAARPDVTIAQAAVGGLAADSGRIELTVSGPLASTSDIVRKASDGLGGSILACRGPFSVEFLRTAGAVGAVSVSIRLGEAMFSAQGKGGDAMISAVVDTLGGRIAATGEVTQNTVSLAGAYDVGHITIKESSHEVGLAVCNEYMALDIDGQRAATFPDLIVLLDVGDGMPVGATPAKPGDRVAVIVVESSNIPVGAGVWDPDAYTGVEKLTGTSLASYALTSEDPRRPRS